MTGITDPIASLRTARSFLFVPANRPERFDKAAAAGADVVIIDLEDAVDPEDKDAAREHIAGWLAAGKHAVLRINAAATPWHTDDVELASRHGAPVMLAKASSADEVIRVAQATAAPVLPLIETARGILAAPAIGRYPVSLDWASAPSTSPSRSVPTPMTTRHCCLRVRCSSRHRPRRVSPPPSTG